MSDLPDVIILMIIGVALFAGIILTLTASIIMARRKVRKEIGLLKTHLKFRPDRPVRRYHFGEYGKVQNQRSEDESQ